MSSPTPLLVVPALLWTAAAGASLITSIALSIRAKRHATAAWNPFDAGFPIPATAAIAGYTLAAVITESFSPGNAAFSVLWPTMAATAVAYTAERRTRTWPQWAGAAFAAIGAALYGSLPT